MEDQIMEAVTQAKRLEQTKQENLNKIFDILKDHPDIKKLKSEDKSIKINVTLYHKADAEEFKEWADDVYRLLLRNPISFFDAVCSRCDEDDKYNLPLLMVVCNQKDSQEDFEARRRQKQKDILWSLFSDYTKSKYGITVSDLNLFLTNMLKISVDEFISHLKELRDNEWTSNNK